MGKKTISFIGAGRVGMALGKLLAERGGSAGLAVVGYESRTAASAERAHAFVGGQVFPTAVEAAQAADIVFVTTQDGVISQVWEELAAAARAGRLSLEGKTICHCSGALPSDLFEGAQDLGADVATVHPLYAVSSGEVWRELADAWFCVEGPGAAADFLAQAWKDMGLQVESIHTSDKVRYHAAAVMASNLVVGLYSRAAAELELCGFSPQAAERALVPLFLGNAHHLATDGVERALTGPAQRGDTKTIEAHLAVLDGDDRKIYQLLTKELLDIAKRRRAREAEA